MHDKLGVIGVGAIELGSLANFLSRSSLYRDPEGISILYTRSVLPMLI